MQLEVISQNKFRGMEERKTNPELVNLVTNDVIYQDPDTFYLCI